MSNEHKQWTDEQADRLRRRAENELVRGDGIGQLAGDALVALDEIKRLNTERDRMNGEWFMNALQLEAERDRLRGEVERLQAALTKATTPQDYVKGCAVFLGNHVVEVKRDSDTRGRAWLEVRPLAKFSLCAPIEAETEPTL